MKNDSQRKWQLPECLHTYQLDQGAFLKWLDRKAKAHVRRDKQRGFNSATVPDYKQAILDAIERANGFDYYTGEKLDWHRIGLWRNAEAAEGRGDYRKAFWNLPSVDHDFTDPQKPVFHICSWRMNDSKNDQSLEEFLALAEQVRRHRGSPRSCATSVERSVVGGEQWAATQSIPDAVPPEPIHRQEACFCPLPGSTLVDAAGQDDGRTASEQVPVSG